METNDCAQIFMRGRFHSWFEAIRACPSQLDHLLDAIKSFQINFHIFIRFILCVFRAQINEIKSERRQLKLREINKSMESYNTSMGERVLNVDLSRHQSHLISNILTFAQRRTEPHSGPLPMVMKWTWPTDSQP